MDRRGSAMRSYRAASSDQDRIQRPPQHVSTLKTTSTKTRHCLTDWRFWRFFARRPTSAFSPGTSLAPLAVSVHVPGPAPVFAHVRRFGYCSEGTYLTQVESAGPFSTTPNPKISAMVVPEAIIEATEKGMVGENLLCASVPSMEKATSTASAAKPQVLTRAEEACKSPPKSAAELEGHVKIKGVDV